MKVLLEAMSRNAVHGLELSRYEMLWPSSLTISQAPTFVLFTQGSGSGQPSMKFVLEVLWTVSTLHDG